MKKELFGFVLQSFFITLIDLGAQIRGAQTWYTIVNFGLNQPLAVSIYTTNFLSSSESNITKKYLSVAMFRMPLLASIFAFLFLFLFYFVSCFIAIQQKVLRKHLAKILESMKIEFHENLVANAKNVFRNW